MAVLPSRKTLRRTILVFGTFDLLHAGHRSFLQQAKRLGHFLIVAVGRDHVVHRLKGQRPVHNERRRWRAVAKLPFVDRALLAPRDPRQRFRFIARHRPHTIALGYDQTHYATNLAADLLRRGIRSRVVRLRPYRPHRFKTAILRRRLNARAKPATLRRSH